MRRLCLLPSSCLPPILCLPPLPTSSHPALLPGLLLLPGRHVRPDHVGDAAHSGRLCAALQRPRPLPRSVSPRRRGANVGSQSVETGSTPLWAHPLFMAHQWDAVTIILLHHGCFFGIDLFILDLSYLPKQNGSAPLSAAGYLVSFSSVTGNVGAL